MRNSHRISQSHPEVQSDWQEAELGYSSPSHAVPQNPNGPTPKKLDGDMKSTVDKLESVNPFMCLTAIAGCSLVISIQAVVDADDISNWEGEYAWALAAGVISLVFSLLMLSINMCSIPLFRTLQPFVGMLLFLWWIFGTGVSTFKAPFNKTGNGFFAAWLAFVFSFLLAGASMERLRNCMGSGLTRILAGDIESKLEVAILGCSFVLVCATIVEATSGEITALKNVSSVYEQTTTAEVWGIVCGTVSALFIFFHKALRLCCEAFTLSPWVVGGILTVWWGCGVVFLTFSDPYNDGGNGYFACWLGLIFAMWLTYEGFDGYDFVGFGRRKERQGSLPPHQPFPGVQ